MNVRRIIGNIPEQEKKISDMEIGESGYTVPWAYQDGNLNTDFPISEKGGTVSLWVECIGENEYAIEFEEPKYRNPFS